MVNIKRLNGIIWGVTLILSSSLFAEKLLVLPWTSLGMELDLAKAKVSTKLFAGELAKSGRYQVIEGDEPCEKTECAIEKGKEKGADMVIIGSINRLEMGKYFLEIKSIEISTENITYVTQYPLESLENLDITIKLLAKAFLEGKQAEEVALEQEGGWKRKARVAPSVRFGYNYFIGKNSYRREQTPTEPPTFSEEKPQRAFDLDLGLTYYMTNQISVDFTARFEFENRGMQLLVPLNYFLNQADFSPFVQGGILFGFGPPPEERSSDYWSSQRDGFGLITGTGILLFRPYDFNLIFNLRYTVIFNKIVDQRVGFTFGVIWAPKTRF